MREVNLLCKLVVVSPSCQLVLELCPLLVLLDLCTHRLAPLLVIGSHFLHLKLLHIGLVFLERGEYICNGGKRGLQLRVLLETKSSECRILCDGQGHCTYCNVLRDS